MSRNMNLNMSLTEGINMKMSEYEHGYENEFDCESE